MKNISIFNNPKSMARTPEYHKILSEMFKKEMLLTIQFKKIKNNNINNISLITTNETSKPKNIDIQYDIIPLNG